jgi:hypothetical protein
MRMFEGKLYVVLVVTLVVQEHEPDAGDTSLKNTSSSALYQLTDTSKLKRTHI